MLQFSNVCVSYGQKRIIEGITATFEENSCHFICGRSGSGKSTFLKLIDQEIKPTSGTILWFGRPITSYKKYEMRREIGIVFQSFELVSHMTVLENVLLASKAIGTSPKESMERAMRLLKRVGLEQMTEQFPDTLSGGQMQRVAIVRALMNRPKLLLADEPTGNLDQQTANDVMQLLYELHEEEQMTLLIVTHSEQFLTQFESHIWHVEEGRFYERTSI